jgi:hypothetical protein
MSCVLLSSKTFSSFLYCCAFLRVTGAGVGAGVGAGSGCCPSCSDMRASAAYPASSDVFGGINLTLSSKAAVKAALAGEELCLVRFV